MSVGKAELNGMLSRFVMLSLRIGMYLSLGLLVLGVIASITSDSPIGSALMPWEALLSACRGEAIGLLSLGIVCLIASPLAGAIAALLVFLRAGEWRFVLMALAVLGVVALASVIRVMV